MRWLKGSWVALALLVFAGCKKDDADGKKPGDDPAGPGQTGPITSPWDPFEAGLNVLIDGQLVPVGGTIELGEAPVGFQPLSTAIWLSNASDAPVSLSGDADSWLSGDPRITWEVPPPGSIAAGDVVEASLLFDPVTDGPASATLDLPGSGSYDLSGVAAGAAPLIIVGRLGRTLVSDDYGASFFYDQQENNDPYANEWADNTTFNDVVYANGQFIAVGGNTERRFAVSEDGLTWQNVNTGYPGSMGTVAYGLGLYMATDDGDILWSTNGVNWIEEVGSWRPGLGALVFGGDRFVGVGGTRRVVSLDGTSWAVDIDAATDLCGLAYGNGVFAAVGSNGRVAWSTDGETWSEQTLGTANRCEIAFGNGMFLIGGWPDNAFTSTDGQNWTEVVANEQMGPMGFANGYFFAASWVDRLWRSADGVTWTMIQDNSSPQMAGYTAMAFGVEP